MTNIPPLIALAVTLIGSVYLYLGAPRQQWLARPFSPVLSRLGGAGLLVVGWTIWFTVYRPATAFFIVLTLTMTTLILLPAGVAVGRKMLGRPS